MRKRPAVSELERHYSRFRDERQRIEEEIIHAGVSGSELRATRQLRIDQLDHKLACLHECLELIEEGWSPERLPGKRYRRGKPTRDRRQLLSFAYDVLREATGPMATAEIMEASVHRAPGLTPAQAADQGLRAALTTLLRGQARAGAIQDYRGRPVRWRIIRSPEEPSSPVCDDER